ncbi:hypothetical protein ACFQH8_16065 [Halomicroarcula sp. GCM10025710]
MFDHALGLQRVTVDGTFSAVMSDLDRIYGEGLTVAEIDFTEAEINRAGFHEAHIDVFRCPNAHLSVILTEATFYEEFSVDNATFGTVVDGQEARSSVLVPSVRQSSGTSSFWKIQRLTTVSKSKTRYSKV